MFFEIFFKSFIVIMAFVVGGKVIDFAYHRGKYPDDEDE